MSDLIIKQGRGAPKGNTNALKHGFYSRNFRRLEASDLEAALSNGLSDEITMLRVALRRLFDLSEGFTTPDDATKILTTLGLTCTHLANLLRTEKLFTGELKSTDDAITTAISQLMLELVK
jgi:hypothetical protein